MSDSVSDAVPDFVKSVSSSEKESLPEKAFLSLVQSPPSPWLGLPGHWLLAWIIVPYYFPPFFPFALQVYHAYSRSQEGLRDEDESFSTSYC